MLSNTLRLDGEYSNTLELRDIFQER